MNGVTVSVNLDELYQDVIIEHSRSPRNFGELVGATHRVEGYNPLCGDQVTLYLKVVDGRVTEAKFTGSGCAISTASASLLTESVVGLTTGDALDLFEEFHRSMMGGDALPADRGSLLALEGVKTYPMRVKCATLPWHALRSALTDKKATVTTE
jgi:nitrogen fixation NifU-like protein